MAVYYYKVAQVTGASVKRHTVKLITENAGMYGTVYYPRDVSSLSEIASEFVEKSGANASIEPTSPIMYVDGMAGATNPSTFGFTDVTPASSLIVGTRFVFANDAYIEVTANTSSASSSSIGRNITYRFVWGQNSASVQWYTSSSLVTYSNGQTNIGDLFPVYRSTGAEGSNRWYFYGDCIYQPEWWDPQAIGRFDFTGLNYATDEMMAFYEYVLENVEPFDTDDPYSDINNSAPSGKPNGGGLPTGDDVNIPSLPTISVADTGFITLFNPSLAQVKNLADYMWGSLFDISSFKKIFADPMDCILGFNLLPVAIPNGGSGTVTVGNISTGVSMTKAGSQWVELDCGTINIGKPYANYLDYSPYTKYSIYLPYIGTVSLSADDCVGKNIHLVYHIDVLSCSCVAYLKCGSSVLYQFTGACGYSIPITAENFRSTISSIISIVGAVGGAIAGGFTAPLVAGAMASTAGNVLNSKPELQRSGKIGSSAGIMGIQVPYLILEFPNPCKPSKQYKYEGYPSFVTVTVGDLSGYTEFSSIILDEVTCDEDEKQLIEDVLKGGVFL